MDAKAKEQADRERLEKMTVKELRVIAKEEGIALGYDAARKENAIGLILEWRRFKGCYMRRC